VLGEKGRPGLDKKCKRAVGRERGGVVCGRREGGVKVMMVIN